MEIRRRARESGTSTIIPLVLTRVAMRLLSVDPRDGNPSFDSVIGSQGPVLEVLADFLRAGAPYPDRRTVNLAPSWVLRSVNVKRPTVSNV